METNLRLQFQLARVNAKLVTTAPVERQPTVLSLICHLWIIKEIDAEQVLSALKDPIKKPCAQLELIRLMTVRENVPFAQLVSSVWKEIPQKL